MSPLAVLTALILGSAVAISFGLSAVLVIFWIIRNDSEQIGVEIGRLPLYCAMFLALAAVSAAALYSLMKNLAWLWRAQAGMWLALLVLGLVIWLR